MEIEILDYNSNGPQKQHLTGGSGNGVWWSHPFRIDYQFERHCYSAFPDFADVVSWAFVEGICEDWSDTNREGTVIMSVPEDVQWSPSKQDAIFTKRGKWLFTFHEFLDEVLTEKQIENFIKYKIGNGGNYKNSD